MTADPTAEHIDREPASIVGEFIDDEAMMATGRSIGVVASFRIATALLAEPTMRAALAASLPAEVKAASMTDAEMLAALVDRGNDAELARRLEWATGLIGATLLVAIRSEGLEVVRVKPEQVAP